jgi:hypothetical protein
MSKLTILIGMTVMGLMILGVRLHAFEEDVFQTSQGDLKIVFIGHATLIFHFSGKTIYVDPVRSFSDYSMFPRADIILVTHEHGDHLDQQSIQAVRS